MKPVCGFAAKIYIEQEKSTMKNLKKAIALVAALTMSACVLTGCNGSGSGSTSTASTASSAASDKIQTVDDLKGKKIGVQLGTTGDIYASDVKDAKIERYNKGADAIMALKQGKIDCVIIDEQPAKVFVSKNDGLEIVPEEFTVEDYAAVIKKDNKELLNKVNTALAELKADGTLDKIISSYIPAEGEEAGTYHYTQTVTEGENLVMATNAEFPPYEYKEASEIVGIDVEIGRAVADKLGMVLKVEDMAFDSIISAVNSGKADIGLAGFTVTEDRKKQVNFSDSYTTSKQVIIIRK